MRGRLNTFLQGDTGSGKTQIMRDVVKYFGNKSLFILGRNDMDTRELFQQVNPNFLRAIREGRETEDGMKFKELTDRVNYNFIGVDELPNCMPAVRAQLFNLFDGFIEIDGKAYPLGSGYSVGIATGNIGQQFTESANELGRALKDRMHVVIDTDYFRPQPSDTFEILSADRNPRVRFDETLEDKTDGIIEAHVALQQREVPFEKYVVAGYLVHGLDYLDGDRSKIGMKSGWPNKLEAHEVGSDAALVLPVSPRAAKSIITLSQALDAVAEEKGATDLYPIDSMMAAFKFVGAYSGILNESMVMQTYEGNNYRAIDAVVDTTRTQFEDQKDNIAAGIEMLREKKKSEKIMREFSGRWGFMKNVLEHLADQEHETTT
jgi:MoxR-like ATPase